MARLEVCRRLHRVSSMVRQTGEVVETTQEGELLLCSRDEGEWWKCLVLLIKDASYFGMVIIIM